MSGVCATQNPTAHTPDFQQVCDSMDNSYTCTSGAMPCKEKTFSFFFAWKLILCPKKFFEAKNKKKKIAPLGPTIRYDKNEPT